MSNTKQDQLDMQEHVNLQQFTTFRCGGTARYFIQANTNEEIQQSLQFALQNNLPWVILGGGSNTLFQNGTYEGVVIQIRTNTVAINEATGDVQADAGAPLTKLAKTTIQKGLQGFEWAAGVPGTVGGAIRGNAGCFGGEIQDSLKEVHTFHVVNNHIEEQTVQKKDLQFQYRESLFKHDPSYVLLSGKWKLTKGNTEELTMIYQHNLAAKIASQPTGKPCAGSFFKGIDVSTLTQEAQQKLQPYLKYQKQNILPVSLLTDKALKMKGYTHGGAQISEKHAGYILNTGNATTEDVISIAKEIEKRMKKEYNVTLEREVEVVENTHSRENNI